MKKPFAEAAWYFLAACEEVHFLSLMSEMQGDESSSKSDYGALVDNVIVHSKWPMAWLFRSCPPNGSVPTGYDDDNYQASADLSTLAMKYLPFESAFSYATWGLADIRIDGAILRTDGVMTTDEVYDAYDRLIDSAQK